MKIAWLQPVEVIITWERYAYTDNAAHVDVHEEHRQLVLKHARKFYSLSRFLLES